MIAEDIYEALILLAKIVLAFQRILAGQFTNPYDEAGFQANLFGNIDPDTAKAVIVVTHCPNRTMHKINTSFNRLPIIF